MLCRQRARAEAMKIKLTAQMTGIDEAEVTGLFEAEVTGIDEAEVNGIDEAEVMRR